MTNKIEFSAREWNASYLIEVPAIKSLLNSLDFLNGGRIQEIWTMGLIFESDKGYVQLDEPIVLIIDGIQFEVLCLADNIFKIGVNTLTMTEKSYQGVDWSNEVEKLFEEVVGSIVVGVEVKSVNKKDENHVFGTELPEQDEYIESVELILDSGKRMKFTGFYDYMEVYLWNDSGGLGNGNN